MGTDRERVASLARAVAFHLVSNGDCPQGVPRDFFEQVKKNSRRYEAKLLASAKSLLVATDNRPETKLAMLYGYTFRDGRCNWGRIVAVYAFAAVLGKECPAAREKVAESTGCFVAEHLSQWICQQGGWDQSKSRLKTAGHLFQLTTFMAACLSEVSACIGMFFS